jgi:spore coat polysaccharide biosynthesis protein SpsF
MKVITVIQARSGSSRLPGKVFLDLCGKPLLVRMTERVLAARLSGTVVIATTTEKEDDRVADLCRDHGLLCFRGHPTDLLDRHYRCGAHFKADIVVKIPSDCPLIDPAVIDRVMEMALNSDADYLSNLHPATYPDGNDVEAIRWEALSRAWGEAERDFEREHTTPYIWERPQQFKLMTVKWENGLDYSMSHRFTIDYREDYDFIKAVYEELFPKNPLFGLNDILQLLEQRPDIAAINKKYAGVNWYRHHLGELTTVDATQTKTI